MIKIVEVEEVYNLRLEVLRKGYELESVKFLTDKVENAFHLAYFLEDKITTVASFSPDDHKLLEEKDLGSQYRIRGMATRKSEQRKGAGESQLCVLQKYK